MVQHYLLEGQLFDLVGKTSPRPTRSAAAICERPCTSDFHFKPVQDRIERDQILLSTGLHRVLRCYALRRTFWHAPPSSCRSSLRRRGELAALACRGGRRPRTLLRSASEDVRVSGLSTRRWAMSGTTDRN